MNPTELELYQYIEDHRPEMLFDQETLMTFIKGRAEESGKAYEIQVQSGVDPLAAQEMAHHILYENLSFCPCQAIEDVIERNYRVTAHPTILTSCYQAVKDIFDEYPATDEFYLSAEYEKLSQRIEFPIIQYLRHWNLENQLESGVRAAC